MLAKKQNKMKKTTYIFLFLIIAGLAFAVALPVAIWQTYSTDTGSKPASPEVTVELTAFNNIRINNSGKTIMADITIASSDSVSAPALSLFEEHKALVTASISADTLFLTVNTPADDSEKGSHTYITVPITVSMPATTLNTICADGTDTNICLNGVACDTLNYSCTAGRFTFLESSVDNMTAGRAEPRSNGYISMENKNSRIKSLVLFCGEGSASYIEAAVDTLTIRPHFDGNSVNLRQARIGNVAVKPASTCGCVEVLYGPETITSTAE